MYRSWVAFIIQTPEQMTSQWCPWSHTKSTFVTFSIKRHQIMVRDILDHTIIRSYEIYKKVFTCGTYGVFKNPFVSFYRFITDPKIFHRMYSNKSPSQISFWNVNEQCPPEKLHTTDNHSILWKVQPLLREFKWRHFHIRERREIRWHDWHRRWRAGWRGMSTKRSDLVFYRSENPGGYKNLLQHVAW